MTQSMCCGGESSFWVARSRTFSEPLGKPRPYLGKTSAYRSCFHLNPETYGQILLIDLPPQGSSLPLKQEAWLEGQPASPSRTRRSWLSKLITPF